MCLSFSHFMNPVAANNDPTCVEGGTYNAPHILIFILAMILIGCGGTPIFTLGTTYIDDHVKKESSSMYIGIHCFIDLYIAHKHNISQIQVPFTLMITY